MPPYLERHGTGYRVTMGVPKALRDRVGSARLRRSLGTDSRREALRLMGPVVSEFLALIDDAKIEAPPSDVQPLGQWQAEALRLREALAEERSRGNEAGVGALEDLALEHVERIRGASVHDDDADVDPDKEAAASHFFTVAMGRETPVEDVLAEYHRERSDLTARTKADNARAVSRLLEHCKRRHLRPTVEQINRREAGRFVSAMQDQLADPKTGATISNKTVNKYLTGLRSLWTWMEKRGFAESNVWSRQSLPKEKRAREDRERPFTDDEVARLLSGEPSRSSLYPIMLIAALSGARLDAVVSLRVRDVQGGQLHFKPQKSEPDARDVPIHSRLQPLIDSLAAGRGADEDLFVSAGGAPDYPDEGGAVARSNTASKAFTYYRRTVGVDEKRDGNRRGLVNFHSFRRWFITKAHQAGQPEHIVHAVVGHRITGMSFGVYSGGASIEQLRACVEAVQLPAFRPPKRWSAVV